MGNANLNTARKKKDDEFYTRLEDINNELQHYWDHFEGKTVICNCDDPLVSNFVHYFIHQFNHLKIKRLIATCYRNQRYDMFTGLKSERAVYLDYTGCKDETGIPTQEEIENCVHHLKGDGDFRSPECVELLKQADIVVTNPPFSLFREYISLLYQYNKKFLVIGNFNAVTCKEIFPLIRDGKLWLGYNFVKEFKRPDDSIKKFGNVCWFTNLTHNKQNEELFLYKKYYGNEDQYPKYDNYDAINVDKVADIPEDYFCMMGVPITFLDKYNPDQFEILGLDIYVKGGNGKRFSIGGKEKYARIVIRRK